MPEDYTDEAKQIEEVAKAAWAKSIEMCAGSPLFSHATKREVAAFMAMQGMLAAGGYYAADDWPKQAGTAVKAADALLAELAKEPSHD